MARTIVAPNASELAWIEKNVETATLVARECGGDPADSALPSMRALDRVWETLGEHLRASRGDPNQLINMVGLAYGQCLVARLGLQWAVVTDEHGTEIAVYGEPGEMLVFPTNLIAKRWERREGAFLEHLFAQMVPELERVRAATGGRAL